VFSWSEEKKATLLSIPADLAEAMQALRDDHEFLLQGEVFNKELIESHIAMKLKEHEAVCSRPHPHEMMLYYNM
jgi:glutamine synthetase